MTKDIIVRNGALRRKRKTFASIVTRAVSRNRVNSTESDGGELFGTNTRAVVKNRRNRSLRRSPQCRHDTRRGGYTSYIYKYISIYIVYTYMYTLFAEYVSVLPSTRVYRVIGRKRNT